MGIFSDNTPSATPCKLLVTGGAGFIGSRLIHQLIEHTSAHVLNIDKLTYAGSQLSLADLAAHPRYTFQHLDICDRQRLDAAFADFSPDAVIHLAAESHVDRSINDAAPFIQTNIIGTYQLLEATRQHLRTLPPEHAAARRFLHVSTDEVFGALSPTAPPFSEQSPYDPHSPYSASKASADHLVRAWHRTYGIPTIITNCSNNYGPYQFPEKLIPVVILRCLAEQPIPVYGKGENVRDWLHVDDHCRAIRLILEKGKTGSTYTIGGDHQRSNLSLIRELCAILDELHPRRSGSYAQLITFVEDRAGHDLRYAIDHSHLTHELGWQPMEDSTSGLRSTVQWYLDHQDWCAAVQQSHNTHPTASR